MLSKRKRTEKTPPKKPTQLKSPQQAVFFLSFKNHYPSFIHLKSTARWPIEMIRAWLDVLIEMLTKPIRCAAFGPTNWEKERERGVNIASWKTWWENDSALRSEMLAGLLLIDLSKNQKKDRKKPRKTKTIDAVHSDLFIMHLFTLSFDHDT